MDLAHGPGAWTRHWHSNRPLASNSALAMNPALAMNLATNSSVDW